MSCRFLHRTIVLPVLLGGNQYKRPLVSQHSKNNITELVHDRSERGHLGLAFAFLLVVGAEGFFGSPFLRRLIDCSANI